MFGSLGSLLLLAMCLSVSGASPKPVLLLTVPASKSSSLAKVTQAAATVANYGECTSRIVTEDIDVTLAAMGVEHKQGDEIMAFVIRSGDGSEAFSYLSGDRTSSNVHYLSKDKEAVQRLLLPADWEYLDSETAATKLDTLVIPALLPPLLVMNDENKHAIFRAEFSSFALLFPPVNSTAEVDWQIYDTLLKTAAHCYDWGTSSPKFVIVPAATYPRNSQFSAYYIGGSLGEDLTAPLLILTALKGDAGVVRYSPPVEALTAAPKLTAFVTTVLSGSPDHTTYLRPRFSPLNPHYEAEGITSGIVDLTSRSLTSFLDHNVDRGSVLVMYYDPGCPHSRSALPHMSTAATKYAEGALFDQEMTATFARFDAKWNDVPWEQGGEGRCPGFPSLVLYRNGMEPIDYRTRGDAISTEGVLEFVNQ